MKKPPSLRVLRMRASERLRDWAVDGVSAIAVIRHGVDPRALEHSQKTWAVPWQGAQQVFCSAGAESTAQALFPRRAPAVLSLSPEEELEATLAALGDAPLNVSDSESVERHAAQAWADALGGGMGGSDDDAPTMKIRVKRQPQLALVSHHGVVVAALARLAAATFDLPERERIGEAPVGEACGFLLSLSEANSPVASARGSAAIARAAPGIVAVGGSGGLRRVGTPSTWF